MAKFLNRLRQCCHVWRYGLPEVLGPTTVPEKTPPPPASPPPPLFPSPPEANLANGPYCQLAEDCADLLNEYDTMLPRMNDAVKPFAENVVDRIQEILERNGLEVISGESAFDIIRHKPEPVKNVPQGTPILETLAPGLTLKEKVLRRAKVRVE